MDSRNARRLAGRIYAAIDHYIKPLTAGNYTNCSLNTHAMPTLLRHVWRRASEHPDISKLIAAFDPPSAKGPDLGDFHLGYYSAKNGFAGGSSKSTAKSDAARANGKKGGRPKKVTGTAPAPK